TGSHTTFCLKFRGPRGPVCTLWTVRGHRPVTLTLAGGAAVEATDAMNNSHKLTGKASQAVVWSGPPGVYAEGAGGAAAEAGGPDHTDARVADGARLVADLGDGSWRHTSRRDRLYENGTFALARYPGRFTAEVVQDAQKGKVLRSNLGRQETIHELMPWYGV